MSDDNNRAESRTDEPISPGPHSEALDTGLAAAFGAEDSGTGGNIQISVLKLLSKSLPRVPRVLAGSGDARDWFFVAISEWRLGNEEEARRWYDRAVRWMDENDSENRQLINARAEAERTLGLKPGGTGDKAGERRH